MAVYPISAGSPDYSGTFLPEIWSSRINYKFYDQSVIPAISNTDWEGEISDSGEKVIIRQMMHMIYHLHHQSLESSGSIDKKALKCYAIYIDRQISR